MPEWLPKLTLPDLAVFLVTVFLCLAASKVTDVGDLIGRGWLKLFGGKAPSQKPDGDAS